jgi:hypothetical protein
MTNNEARDAAFDIHSWLSCACIDMAEGDEGSAEDMYNDVDLLMDMIGDRAIDKAKGNREDYKLVLNELIDIEHSSAIKTAARKLIELRT